MRIGINARYLQNPHTGIENYLLQLLVNLKKIDRENNYILFFGNDKLVPPDIRKAGYESIIAEAPADNKFSKILWEHMYLPYALGKYNIDVFHEPSFVAPFIKRQGTVITVYDLTFVHTPSSYTRQNRFYFKMLLTRSIRQADAIITISENSKKDILQYFNIPGHKVKVIYPGIDDFFHKVDDDRIEKVKEIYGIKKDFILNVSLISPRKNLIGLIRAFKRLLDTKKIDCQLVIAGRRGWLYDDIFREVALNNLEKDVIFCGYVPKEHLLLLYNVASVFAYPSLCEGFGLPILEAMACGCPVVASNVSSMPEVCGEAAMLVNPDETESLADAIFSLMHDRQLQATYIEKGFSQAARFSWRKAAEETLGIYRIIFEKKKNDPQA